ncbi:hypothetical protein SARC_04332 [Sphaeroforma arctica JP610]|uniref:Glycosyl transferase family 1 domain-containing protein n=1 Tax=Sphaeroforma arctica JP610 TaxID=667725 RepID=A0A0L0G2V8_9EUKA|nr:hypothetical protein SARC_04332 [Sphaeroforma arctica JP610]KNC83415.1 hypothetical protein SARC_04332 [Sphaeroforma arctica JP610]|eukprot:XP_014157317.1 hypothetical protein SARC_04332 [Sphaeroforma arctica JP610]
MISKAAVLLALRFLGVVFLYTVCIASLKQHEIGSSTIIETNSQELSHTKPYQFTSKKAFFTLKMVADSPIYFFHRYIERAREEGFQVIYYEDLALSDTIPKEVTHVLLYMVPAYFIEFWRDAAEHNAIKVMISEDLNFDSAIRPARDAQAWVDLNLPRYPEALTNFVFNHTQTKPCYNYYQTAADVFYTRNTGGIVKHFNQKWNRVLVSGASGVEWYPLRAKAVELIADQSDVFERREHMGYIGGHAREQASAYADHIGKYKLALGGTCPQDKDRPYLLAKTFEIMASGTALIMDEYMEPYLHKIGMLANVHYISATVATLDAVGRRWLLADMQEQLLNITLNGHEFASSHMRLDDQLDTLFKLTDILSDQKKDGTLGEVLKPVAPSALYPNMLPSACVDIPSLDYFEKS